jgi:hypothetical protein
VLQAIQDLQGQKAPKERRVPQAQVA